MSIVSRFPCSGGGQKELEEVWRVQPLTGGVNVMAVSPSGDIWVSGYHEHTLCKLTSDGVKTQSFWRADSMAWALTVDTAGYIYEGGSEDAIHMYHPLGQELWRHNTDRPGCSGSVDSIALTSSGYVYSGNVADYSCKLIAANGALSWSARGEPFSRNPVVDTAENVYLAKPNGVVYKISPAGARSTLSTGHTATVYCLAIDSKDNIYAGLVDGFVCKLSSTGVIEWESKVVDEIVFALAVDANGKVYASGSDGTLHGLGSDGTKAWSVSIKPSAFTDMKVFESDIIALDYGASALCRFSPPAAGKLYLNPNIYDKAGKEPLEVDWVQETDDPHQLLISCRGGTKKEGI